MIEKVISVRFFNLAKHKLSVRGLIYIEMLFDYLYICDNIILIFKIFQTIS